MYFFAHSEKLIVPALRRRSSFLRPSRAARGSTPSVSCRRASEALAPAWARLTSRAEPRPISPDLPWRSAEHTSELQSPDHLVCRLLLLKKNKCYKLMDLRH